MLLTLMWNATQKLMVLESFGIRVLMTLHQTTKVCVSYAWLKSMGHQTFLDLKFLSQASIQIDLASADSLIHIADQSVFADCYRPTLLRDHPVC